MSYLSDPKEKLIMLGTWLKKRNCISHKIAWVSLREYILRIPEMLISPWQYSAETGNAQLSKKHPRRSFQEKDTIVHLLFLSQYVVLLPLNEAISYLLFLINFNSHRITKWLWLEITSGDHLIQTSS